MNSTFPTMRQDLSARPAYRTNTYIWGLRFIQILFAFIIIVLGGSAISDWHSVGCSSPSKLSFNFAVGLISLFAILYLILSSGPYKPLLPFYSLYTTIALDTLFILLFIVAAAYSTYDCTGLCNACTGVDEGYGYFVWVTDLTCFCWLENDDISFSDKRDTAERIFTPAGKPVSGGRGSESGNAASLGKTLEKSFSTATKKGLDATMILLFLISLTTLLYMRYSRRSERQAQVHGERVAEQVNERMDGTFKMGDTGNGPSVEQTI